MEQSERQTGPNIEEIDHQLWQAARDSSFSHAHYNTDSDFWHSIAGDNELLIAALKQIPNKHRPDNYYFAGCNITEHILARPDDVDPEIHQLAVEAVFSSHDLATDGVLSTGRGSDTMLNLLLTNQNLDFTEEQKDFIEAEINQALEFKRKDSSFEFNIDDRDCSYSWISMDHESDLYGIRYQVVSHPAFADRARRLVPEIYRPDEFDLVISARVRDLLDGYWVGDDSAAMDPVIEEYDRVMTISDEEIAALPLPQESDNLSLQKDANEIRNLVGYRPESWGKFDYEKFEPLVDAGYFD